jgi:hypothetical protein
MASSKNSRVVAAIGVASAVMAAGDRPSAAAPSFRFQNSFWVSLHHTLRGEARRRDVRGPALIKTEVLSDRERATWTSALDAYTPYGRRDVVFDEGLNRINNALTLLADDAAIDRATIDAGAKRGLSTAAPIYRAHFWAAQQQMNDRWIASLQPILAAHAAGMAAAMARVYRVEWLSAPLLVDAASEAGPDGAYTTAGPPGTFGHTTIESENPGLQGEMAFEMIFHEASHPLVGLALSRAIATEAARQKLDAPASLSHVIIFFTAGELARRELGKAGDASYKPYAYRYQLYTRGWQKLRDALERDWLPYLDGKSSWDDALSALVRDAS